MNKVVTGESREVVDHIRVCALRISCFILKCLMRLPVVSCDYHVSHLCVISISVSFFPPCALACVFPLVH